MTVGTSAVTSLPTEAMRTPSAFEAVSSFICRCVSSAEQKTMWQTLGAIFPNERDESVKRINPSLLRVLHP
jgi:hypothetical protein